MWDIGHAGGDRLLEEFLKQARHDCSVVSAYMLTDKCSEALGWTE